MTPQRSGEVFAVCSDEFGVQPAIVNCRKIHSVVAVRFGPEPDVPRFSETALWSPQRSRSLRSNARVIVILRYELQSFTYTGLIKIQVERFGSFLPDTSMGIIPQGLEKRLHELCICVISVRLAPDVRAYLGIRRRHTNAHSLCDNLIGPKISGIPSYASPRT